MKGFFEAFAPSGCEQKMRELLESRLKGKGDSFLTDNMGNLAVNSDGRGLCIECGMDSLGVMAVSKEGKGVRFASVGNIKVEDILERKVIFDGGATGKVCCDEDKKDASPKISDLYIELDNGEVEIGDFGAVDAEFFEDDCSYSAYGLKKRIALVALCKAVERTEDLENVTLLFSAQKRLGGRGLRAFFEVNTFDGVITLDGTEEDDCVIVARDVNTVSEPRLRKALETLAERAELDVRTAVTDENFCMNLVSVSCGDPCAALGIPVICEEGKPDRISKKDFETAVNFLITILNEVKRNVC